MMNSNPWNVESIDEFSYFNCPECTFHSKEKVYFQDHATRNHPLSSVLFCKGTKVIIFSNRNKLNQLKHLNVDKKCKELALKHEIPEKIQVPMSTIDNLNDTKNIERGPQFPKICDETKKDFHPLKENIKNIAPLSKKERMKSIKKSLQSPKKISSEDQNFNNRTKRERLIVSKMTPQSRSLNNVPENFEEIQASVNEFDPLEEIERDLPSNLIHNNEFQNANTLEKLSISIDENIDIGITNDKFPKPETFKLHKSDCNKKITEAQHKSVVIEKGDMISNISRNKPDPENNLTKNQEKMDHSSQTKSYQCQHCEKKFVFRNSLSKHLNKQRCKVLKQQINKNSVSDIEYVCSICMKSFSCKYILKKHVRRVHEANICEQCGEKFDEKRELKLHISSVHERKKLYKCSICHTCLIQASKMKLHMVSVHEKENLANCKPKQLLRMNLVHEVEKSQNCKQCGETFENKRNLKFHTYSVHEGKKLYQCSFCTACFMKSNRLKEHVVSVHEKKNLSNSPQKSKRLYKCGYCNTKFRIQKLLQAHLKKVHERDDQKNDEKRRTKTSKKSENIPVEGKKYFVEYQLPYGWKKVGFQRRSGYKYFYVYAPNGKMFRSNVEIKHYLGMNPEVKCDLDVTNTSNMKNVINNKPKNLQKIEKAKVSEEKQPFGCDICKTYFSSKSDLVSHIESVHNENESYEKPSVHEGKKTIKCPVCEEKFSTINQMKSHIGSSHFHLW